MKDKIKGLTDTTLKKCILVFIVIFVIVVIMSLLSVGYLNDAIEKKRIHEETIFIKDKINSSNLYIIVDENNQTYNMHNDTYSRKMFDAIIINSNNTITIEDPDPSSPHPITHILKVDNETS